MGSGRWNSCDYTSYSTSKGFSATSDGFLDMSGIRNVQDIYTSRSMHNDLNPLNIMRECCDTEEHKFTKPVILGIDVTGSMGSTAMEVSRVLNPLMTELYSEVSDVEFSVMGIGDLAYDVAPIQMSQFESDVRIAEHLDKIYFEGGGGGNPYESYTAAWYMGARHCKLDCWNRGKKGLIITFGDETLNPYLPKDSLSFRTGDNLQGDIETNELYKEVSEKFYVYHVFVNHSTFSRLREETASKQWKTVLPEDHYIVSDINGLKDAIKRIILDYAKECDTGIISDNSTIVSSGTEAYISW